jgi:hypothetical protein
MRAPELDRVVLAVGAAVLIGVLLMVASVMHANGTASSTRPHVTVIWSGNGPGGSPARAATTRAPALATGAETPHAPPGQALGVSVQPGRLTMTSTGDSVRFTHTGTRVANGGRYDGTLPVVTVVDARGSLVGWNATVSLQGIDGLSPAQLAGAQLCALPNAPTIVAGNPGEVSAAGRSCGGIDQPVTVFFARPKGGGGTFTDTATVALTVPSDVGVNPLTAYLAYLAPQFPAGARLSGAEHL